MVATLQPGRRLAEQLASLMVGRKGRLELDQTTADPAKRDCRCATCRDRRRAFRASETSVFDVRAGEIVGIAASRGNRAERAVGGRWSVYSVGASGEIPLVVAGYFPPGAPFARHRRIRPRACAEDRLRLASDLAFPAWESCSWLSRGGGLQWSRVMDH